MPNPNHVLADYIQSLSDETNDQDFTFRCRRAAKSIRTVPFPITSKADALTLKYVGDFFAARIEAFLLNTRTNSPTPQPSPQPSQTPYTPRYRSVPYAFLLALHTARTTPLTKPALLLAAQPFTDENLEPPCPSIAAALAKLNRKNLLSNATPLNEYALSRDGVALAESLTITHRTAHRRTMRALANQRAVQHSTPHVDCAQLPAAAQARAEGTERASGLRVHCADQIVDGQRFGLEQVSTTFGNANNGNERLAIPLQTSSGARSKVAYDEQIDKGETFGEPGDRAQRVTKQKRSRQTVGTSGAAGGGGNGGGKENGVGRGRGLTEGQEKRAIGTIRRLEKDNYEREDCLDVLGAIYQEGRFPRCDDKLYRIMSDRLWERKVEKRRKRAREGVLGLRVSALQVGVQVDPPSPVRGCEECIDLVSDG